MSDVGHALPDPGKIAENHPERNHAPDSKEEREVFGCWPPAHFDRAHPLFIKRKADGNIEDTGPLTKKRMETVDVEATTAALDFMDRANKAEKPFFVWWNSIRMHVWTHLKPESKGKTGQGVYADGMVEHDGMVGQLPDKLKELGIEDNTIVM